MHSFSSYLPIKGKVLVTSVSLSRVSSYALFFGASTSLRAVAGA